MSNKSNNCDNNNSLDEIYERLQIIEDELFYIYDEKAIKNIKQARKYIIMALEELKAILDM